MGEFTLTDEVQDGEGKLNPNVFLRLAQLQGPLEPLFPNLRRLRIVKANYSLDYLHLFLSPSLETLEIVGLGEACRASLLSFLSAAVVEVPNLSTLILGSGQLSRDVVNTCLGFDRLKHLELVNAVSEADYRLLKQIGRLKHLETFVIDAQGVGYAPSQAILQAEDAERARVIAEEERRRQRVEEEKQQCRRRFMEEVEERRRKAALPRVRGICWLCGKRYKLGIRQPQCSSCTLKIAEQEKHMQELDEDERRCKEEEQSRCKEQDERRWREEEEEERKCMEEEERRCMEEAERKWMEEEERNCKEEEQKRYQEVEEERRRCEEAEEEQKRCEEAVAENKRRKEEEDLWSRWNRENAEYKAGRKDDIRHASAMPSLPQAVDGASEDMFPKLLSVTVRGSVEMMQDVVQLVSSTFVVLLCLDMVPVLSSRSPSIVTTPSRRFVDTVDSALGRWAGTIAHVTLSGLLPSVASKLPEETVGALVRLPNLEHLEVNGWDVASNIADYFCSLADATTTKLKALHLPNDSNTTSIPLSKLQTIAGACPPFDAASTTSSTSQVTPSRIRSPPRICWRLFPLAISFRPWALGLSWKSLDTLIIYSPRSRISSLSKGWPRTLNSGGRLISW